MTCETCGAQIQHSRCELCARYFDNDSQHVEHLHERLQDYRERGKGQFWAGSGWIVVIILLIWLLVLHY